LVKAVNNEPFPAQLMLICNDFAVLTGCKPDLPRHFVNKEGAEFNFYTNIAEK